MRRTWQTDHFLLARIIVPMLDKRSQKLERVEVGARRSSFRFNHLIELVPSPTLIFLSRRLDFHARHGLINDRGMKKIGADRALGLVKRIFRAVVAFHF